MSKIELPAVTGSNNTSRINDNFQKIEDALNQEVLYRKGYTGEPNEMETNLDMNGKQILNVVTGTSDGSLVTKGYVDQGLSLKFDKSGGPLSGPVDMQNNQINNLPNATQPSQPATYAQLLQVEASEDSLLRSELAAPDGSELVGFQQSGAGSIPRTSQDKMRERVTPQDFGAVGDGTTLNDAAFLAAKASVGASPIYVPAGVYRLSSPFALGEGMYLYGPGTLVFDKAEWRRRGGSTGTLRTSEQYTLYYEQTGNDADIHVLVNATEVPWTWFSTNVIDVVAAASTTTADTITYYIVGGKLRLGDEPQDINGYCTDLAGGSIMQTDYQPSAVAGGPAYNNFRAGSRAGYKLTTGGSNTYVGARAGASNEEGGNNVVIGYQANYRNQGSANTVVGTIAMEWAINAHDCVAIGQGALGGAINAANNVVIGNGAMSLEGGQSNVVIGNEAHNRGGVGRVMGSSATVGAFAGNYSWGNSNALFGYAAGRGEVDGVTGTDTNNGQQNAFFGCFAGAKISNGSFSVAAGAGAASSAKKASNFVAVGFEAGGSFTNSGDGTFVGSHAGFSTTSAEISAFGANALEFNVSGIRASAFGTRALRNSTGNENSAFGFEAGVNASTGTENSHFGIWAGQQGTTASGNTNVGSRAGQALTTGGFNVNVGRQSGQNLVGGSNNTNVGATAGKLSQDGTNAVSWANSTCLGSDSRVSGSNQVQLGNSTTTTYVYGTVQNRSDERDKTDIHNTELGIEFIMGLRPVDGRWDMREDYFEEYQVQVGIDDEAQPIFETRTRQLPKDGSRARQRKHHWFIAQEVKELCDKLGVDFGGYQDHAVSGGCDVLSLGYDEFIPPMTKAIQQCWQRMDEIERRLKALEGGA